MEYPIYNFYRKRAVKLFVTYSKYGNENIGLYLLFGYNDISTSSIGMQKTSDIPLWEPSGEASVGMLKKTVDGIPIGSLVVLYDGKIFFRSVVIDVYSFDMKSIIWITDKNIPAINMFRDELYRDVCVIDYPKEGYFCLKFTSQINDGAKYKGILPYIGYQNVIEYNPITFVRKELCGSLSKFRKYLKLRERIFYYGTDIGIKKSEDIRNSKYGQMIQSFLDLERILD